MKVIKFSDNKCIPCETYAPIFEDWANEVEEDREDIEIERVVASQEPHIASKYRIMSVPATVFIE